MSKDNPRSMRSAKVRAQEIIPVKIEDTRYLADICGGHDKHLAMIEQALNVYVVPRGNELFIEGSRRETRMAADVVKELIHRLDKGLHAGEAEVSAAIRMVLEGGGVGKTISTSLDQYQIRTQKKTISPRSQRQAAYIDALRRHDLVIGLGPAGTGKTYLAVAIGANMLIRGEVDRLILSRPAVEAGERLGFLPGDMKEKVDPYLRPLYDALDDVMRADQVQKKLESGEIEVAPLAFMRGRTLSNAFVILDEAQNCTRMQIKMFLTRLGENSRMVVTGDPTQIDLSEMGQHAREPGLGEALEILQDIEGVGIIHFTEADVVRHPLVERIVRAYNDRQNG